jgi:hypothetical protein
LPDRDSRRELANTPSKNEASNNELCDVERRALEDLANESEACSDEDQLPASKHVTQLGAGKSTEKRANSEHGHNGSLDSLLVSLDSAVGGDSVHLRECVSEVAKREETANTRLVVTKQDEGRHDNQQQLGDL